MVKKQALVKISLHEDIMMAKNKDMKMHVNKLRRGSTSRYPTK